MKLKIYNQKRIIFLAFALAAFVFYVFSRSSCAGGLVPCTDDCNLCYLLVGISNIFLYLAGSLLMAAVLLGIVIGGMTFIVSGLFPKALNFAKLAFSVSLKAFVIFLCGWLAINSIMNIVGYKHPLGGKWWQFDCAGNANTQTASSSNTNNSSSSKSQCDANNKKLDSIKIQCAEKTTSTSTTSQTSEDGTGFYVALDTLSEDEKGKTKQLKAIGKYSCDGTTSEEDITQQAEWKASDETQIKVAKGLVQAVAKNMTSESPPYVEAKFQEKNSNQAKVYVNSCPNTGDKNAQNKLSLTKDILFPKANAQEKNTGSETCKSCGATENSTCHFIYGNKDAKYKFILMPGAAGCSGEENPCKQKLSWSQSDEQGFENFKKAAEILAKDIDYAPDGKNNFAVYRSDLIADKDPSCPPLKKFDSYGYICNGSGGTAHAAYRGDGSYCIDFIKSGNAVLAHEQIGHAFAQLDDEYTNSNKNPNDYPSPHYNCTDIKNTLNVSYKPQTKWGDLVSVVWAGCFYSMKFSRSSFDSIMGGSDTPIFFSHSFGVVSETTIKETVQNFPNGPSFGGEQLTVQ